MEYMGDFLDLPAGSIVVRELQLSFIHCITAVDVYVSYKFLITKVLHVAGHFSTQQKLL